MSITADQSGHVRGTFRIPSRVPCGSKTVKFQGAGGSHGEAVFVGQGEITSKTLQQVKTITSWYYDPLAQSFTFERDLQLAGANLWFTAAGSDVRVQLREMSNGVPTRITLAEAILSKESIVVSGGGHTPVLFPSPVKVTAGTEYCFVILCNDAETKVSVAEMGQYDAISGKFVLEQPYTVGVLLSSSNASSWSTHQDKDMAFRALQAVYDGTTPREIELGTADVEGVTDMLVEAVVEIPSAACRVEFELTLPQCEAYPRGGTLVIAAGQPVILDGPVTGSVSLKAVLYGDETSSPILYPGTQLVTGKAATTGDYYTRSITATGAAKAVLIFDALVPSGTAVSPSLQIDGGEWAAMSLSGTKKLDNGVIEFRYETALSSASLVKAKLDMSGTVTARPVLGNIRLIASI